MQNQEWEIPPNLQPDPDEYEFDLERAGVAVDAVAAILGLPALAAAS